MRGKSGEIAEMAARRRLDFCCVQESRWKGGSARIIGYDDGWYKFFWVGCEEGVAGVGVLVTKKWIESVVEVRRVSERVMVLRLAIGKSLLNIVSVYAPQVGG
jgi:exonuclease III